MGIRVPFGQVHLMHSPTSRPSRVVRARGGRGGRAMYGQESRMVEAGLVRLGEEWLRQAVVCWTMVGWAALSDSLGHVLVYPSYVPSTGDNLLEVLLVDFVEVFAKV